MRTLFITLILIAGCATKQYPIAVPLSYPEAARMSCDDLETKLVEVDRVERQIDETGELDGRTVLGALGDFGIGNSMAKEEAREALQYRRDTIEYAMMIKNCYTK